MRDDARARAPPRAQMPRRPGRWGAHMPAGHMMLHMMPHV